MSEDLETAAAALRERVGAEPFEGAARFEIENAGVIRVAGTDVVTGADAAAGPADVTIAGSLETFRDLFEGALSPTTAFMSGRIRIEGDMGLALRLGQIIG